MDLDKTLFFRKPITPWYDSNFACWVMVIFCFIVFTFALVGIFIAAANPVFNKYLWFPYMLAFLNIILVVKVLLRMKTRNKSS